MTMYSFEVSRASCAKDGRPGTVLRRAATSLLHVVRRPGFFLAASQGQGNLKGGALVDLALDAHLTAVRVCDPRNDRKA